MQSLISDQKDLLVKNMVAQPIGIQRLIAFPFYLKSADSKVSKQLLMYRYKHLDKAIENAEKLGFKNGAALYPMVTMNGEECHNEWEITFEEIHRNGAIAFAIYNYWRHTSDDEYIAVYGKRF